MNSAYNDLGSFLFFEDLENKNSFRLLELSKSDKKYGIKFCILPYLNATISQPQTTFFDCVSERQIDIKEIDLSKNKALVLLPSTSKEQYIKKVNALKQQIQQGNIYEINYCIEFFANNVEIDPISVFIKLQQLTKAPHCRLVKLGNEYIISASPELFLKKEGNIVYTKPIKGTVKRGKTIEEDEQLKNKLHTSIKERTENVMAVDVARNDLSVIAKKGTVNVNKLYNIESFETVHQMVSTVSCELKENTDFKTIINATFPMASMTGAPKVSAMKLINEFEDFERNYYSGAMGLIDEKGDFELSVIIRSIFYNQQTKRVSIAVGSAITHLCEPEKEYEECLLKAGALLKALNAEIIN